MTSGVLGRAANRFLPGVLIASALLAACSAPNTTDFFGGEPPGGSGKGGRGGSGGNMAGSSGSGNAGSGTGGTTSAGGSAGTAGSTSGAAGSAGSEASGGTAGMETGGTAGMQTGGTAGMETGGTAGVAGTAGTAGDGSGGAAGSTAGTSGNEAGAGGMNEGGSGGTPVCVPEFERCDGLDNDCDHDIDESNVCPQDCVGAHFEGHDYLFCASDDSGPIGGGRTWSQARTVCITQAKVLVHLETEAEAKFVYSKLTELDFGLDAWMGATDRVVEDEWSWEGASTLDSVPFYDDDAGMAIDDFFVDWGEEEPDGEGDCGAIEDWGDEEFVWNDLSCSDPLAMLVCEGES